jgi:hypothetical protein
MKKLISFYPMGKIVVPFWRIVFLTLFTAFFAVAATLRAENREYIGPVFPTESDFEEFEDGYRPNSLSPNRGKQLPLPTRKPYLSSALRQAGFDGVPSANETIIPQRLLVDDSDSESLPIPIIPKLSSKKKPQADSANSMTLSPPLNTDIPLDEGEFIVDETNTANNNLLAWSADSASNEINNATNIYNENNGEIYGNGIYNEMSPFSAGNYFGPAMIKPFGTGLLDNLTIFGGTTGFKGELDNGSNGNFGFSEGINWSGPATPQGTVSGQVGLRAVQSNINGNSHYGKDSRNQYFITAGLFKRELMFPIQGGAVIDLFQDDFYGKIRGQQIRYELSVRTFSNTEDGFIGGFGASKKGNAYLDLWKGPGSTLQPQHHYLLFLRKHFASGGVAEFRAGMTAFGDTILVGLGEFPLSDRFSVHGGFTGSIPKEGHGYGGASRETWEISAGVTFYFRGGACSKPVNPCRPMFDVAGNNSFFNRIVKK